MKNKIIQLETSHNQFAQYRRSNDIVFSGIPESRDDDNLKKTNVSILSEIKALFLDLANKIT